MEGFSFEYVVSFPISSDYFEVYLMATPTCFLGPLLGKSFSSTLFSSNVFLWSLNISLVCKEWWILFSHPFWLCLSFYWRIESTDTEDFEDQWLLLSVISTLVVAVCLWVCVSFFVFSCEFIYVCLLYTSPSPRDCS